MTILGVAIGSALGTMLRYIILNTWSVQSKYFTAVFIVNMVGSCALGYLMGTGASYAMHSFWTTGVIAGLTTFSTMMTQSSQYTYGQQVMYLALQIIFGMIFFSAGTALITIL
ncbi:CrcB family protein [Leuconostoc koreense]|nr:CrcB family protein [Leuconostoc mesenteroides]QGM25008.1 CrcB family protein [Leuconostoc mesenteroides subsp. mesenteroides]